MTIRAKPDTHAAPASSQTLPLLADKKELLRIRIRPAEFARLMGVSKQTVSDWVKHGRIAPPSLLDGRLDVQRAIQDVLRNTSPGRLRARVLRQAVDDVQQLRANLAQAEERIESLEGELARARKAAAYSDYWIASSEAAERVFMEMLVDRAESLRAAPAEAWPDLLGEILDAASVAGDIEAIDDPEDVATLQADLAEIMAALDINIPPLGQTRDYAAKGPRITRPDKTWKDPHTPGAVLETEGERGRDHYGDDHEIQNH